MVTTTGVDHQDSMPDPMTRFFNDSAPPWQIADPEASSKPHFNKLSEQTFDMEMNPIPRKHRRQFSDGEKAHMMAVRKAAACQKCRDEHKKVILTVVASHDSLRLIV